MRNTAIYPGSFDPFTNGHLDIVKKASRLFARVYVVVSVNSAKRRSYSAEDTCLAIRRTLERERLDNCEVCICRDLVAEFAKQRQAGYMIRGLRNNLDYNYEENLAEINKLINPELEYVYFRAENVALSSSMVKELFSYHSDISRYVPQAVLELMEGEAPEQTDADN